MSLWKKYAKCVGKLNDAANYGHLSYDKSIKLDVAKTVALTVTASVFPRPNRSNVSKERSKGYFDDFYKVGQIA
jgi:hypothetical protein